MAVRRMLHAAGDRYRIHVRDLPGTPDIVFPKRKKVIFLHGCFGHSHDDPACAHRYKRPRSNLSYWQPKLKRACKRDRRHNAALTAAGWDVSTIWES